MTAPICFAAIILLILFCFALRVGFNLPWIWAFAPIWGLVLLAMAVAGGIALIINAVGFDPN